MIQIQKEKLVRFRKIREIQEMVVEPILRIITEKYTIIG